MTGVRRLATTTLLLLTATGATPAPRPALAPEARRAIEAQGRRYVAAMDSSAAYRERTVRELFVPRVATPEAVPRLVAQMDKVRENYGPFTFHHVDAIASDRNGTPSYSMHVFVKSRKDQRWRDIQFILDAALPHRIESLVFLAEVTEPVYLPNGAIDAAPTLAWLDHYVDKLATDDDLSGGLLIARGEQALFERYVGFADSARRRPMSASTRIHMASGSKMFTALAIAKLVETGKLRFEDSLARVAPRIALPAARRVTIGQLLSHTSGIGEYWTEDYTRHRAEVRALADYLPWIAKAGTTSEPGTAHEYSNSNYILLGLAIEAVAGRSYEQVVQEVVLKPAGMVETGFFPFDPADPKQTDFLVRAPQGWARAPIPGRGSSAGGCVTTCRDMLRFTRALAAGAIVSPAMLERMTTSQTAGIPGASAYGYGFILERGGGMFSYGHGGITRGVNFELRCFPSEDLALVAFSNQDNGAYDDLRRNAIRLVTGER